MRGRHHQGDDQIRALWRHAREFADDRADMNFDATTLAEITETPLPVDPVTGKLFEYSVSGNTVIIESPDLFEGDNFGYEVRFQMPGK